MKRKGLYFLIALALGGVGAVHAQDTYALRPIAHPSDMATPTYDGRWYIAPTVGGYYNDTDRNTNSRQVYYGLGFGRFFTPNMSVDVFADRTSRDVGLAPSGKLGQQLLSVRPPVSMRGDWNAWRPYALAA